MYNINYLNEKREGKNHPVLELLYFDSNLIKFIFLVYLLILFYSLRRSLHQFLLSRLEGFSGIVQVIKFDMRGLR